MNHTNKTGITFSLALFIFMAGCTSTNTMRDAPLTEGTERNYEAAFDTVVEATRDAVADAGLGIEDAYAVDESTFVIIGRARSSAFSYGGYARAVVVRGEEETTVRVMTKRKLATNVTAKDDYSGPIFASLDVELR